MHLDHRARIGPVEESGGGEVGDFINFAPRATMPVLILNGRYDSTCPVQGSQLPLFRLLGATQNDKRHVLFDTGHAVPRIPLIKEILEWLDRYMGPVRTGP